MKSFSVAIILVLIGIIFLAGGVGATFNRALTTATCEACGMEIEKSDISSLLVISSDQKEHWACCPICADVVALYYQEAEINGKCFACGREVSVQLKNQSILYVDFSGNKEFIKIFVGGSCMKNKLVCSAACAQSVHESYEWATNVPEKTLQEALVIGGNKLKTMTVDYRPLSIPALNYAMIGISAALFVVAPVTWKLLNKKSETKLPK